MAPGYSTRIVRGMRLRVPSPTPRSSPETSPGQDARRIYGLTPFSNEWAERMALLDPAPLLRFPQFLSERFIGGLGFVLLIEDQCLACAFEEIWNP